MFGWNRKRQNQKLADTLQLSYDDGVYVQTLKEYGLKPMSLSKFGRDLIGTIGLYAGYVDTAGELTDEHTNTMRLSSAYADDLPRYIEAMSKATGAEITKLGYSSRTTSLPWGTGEKGSFNFGVKQKTASAHVN